MPAIDGLTARVAGLEPKVGKPVPDPAAAARTEALENRRGVARRTRGNAGSRRKARVRRQRGEIRAARLTAPRRPISPGSMNASRRSRARCGRRAPRSRSRAASLPIRKADAKPADDMPLRRLVAAALLDVLVRIGEPYPVALAATKPLAPNPDVLKPLDQFAEKGVPNAGRLSTELLALVPKLSPAAQQNNATTTGTGIVERLQAGAAKLVKIERTDTAGTDRGAVVARITAAALRNDRQRGAARIEDAGAGRSRRGAILA